MQQFFLKHLPACIFLLCFVWGITSTVTAQVRPQGIEKVGQLNFGSRLLNDIWGYTAPDGTEYAMVGTYTGTSIVSLADPTAPQEVQFIPGPTVLWRDLKTYGNFLYVSSEERNGILIVDLRNLPAPCVYKDTVLAGIERAHNLWVDQAAGLLYVIGYNRTGGFRVFDIATDPWHPRLVGTYRLRYVHDLYARDGVAYLAEIENERLTILDVSDPANWQVMGSTTYSGAFTHNAWLNDSGTVCFTTDEYGGATVKAWDVQDPRDITFLDEINSTLSNTLATPHNVHVKDDVLYISYYHDGLLMVDAAFPEQMVKIGQYDTSPLEGPGFDASWGAYPFLPSGLILATDRDEGLFVLRFTGDRANQLSLTLIDTFSQAPIANALVATNRGQVRMTDSLGRVRFLYTGVDTFFLNATADLYLDKTQSYALSPGGQVDTQLTLRPIGSGGVILKTVDSLANPVAEVRVETQHLLVNQQTRSQTDGIAVLAPLLLIPSLTYVGKWGFLTDSLTLLPQASLLDTIEVPLTAGLADPFALDLGWQTVGNTPRGQWTQRVPDATPPTGLHYAPLTDIATDLGPSCMMTSGLVNGKEAGLPEGFTTLVSPPFSLAAYQFPYIRLAYWLVHLTAQGRNPRQARALSIELYDGNQVYPLWQTDSDSKVGWEVIDSLSLTDYQSLAATWYLRITAENTVAGSNLWAAIDDFQLFEGQAPQTTHLDHIKPEPLFTAHVDEWTLHYQFTTPPPVRLTLRDFQGRAVWQQALDAPTGHVELPSFLSKGWYLFTLSSQGRHLGSFKGQKP